MSVLIVACQVNSGQNPASQSSAMETENCRMVEHTAGKTCVPDNPERVVVLGVATIGDVLALGVKPVGTILYFNKSNAPPYLEGKLEGVETVGTGNEPNLETILSLNPDLIIMMHPNQGSYNKLSQIAPTVADDWFGYDDWKDHFNFVASVLGKTKEAEEIWANYHRRIEELRAALPDNYQDIQVSFVRICCGKLATDVKNSFSGQILNDIGLSRPPVQDIEVKGGLTSFSEEAIPDMDGDVIFVVVDREDEEAEKMFEQLKQNPLWNQLEAVQEGKVYPVNLPTWRGGNPLAADAVIDDLFKYLVEK
jgi:iron complex transport system substrate-binding protein